MKINELEKVVELDPNEGYIAFGSIIELGGPYHSRFSDHLREFHKSDYDRLKDEIHTNKRFPTKDIPLVLETLYLLIHEMSDWDFGALYDGVTKDDVKILYEKLKKLLKLKNNSFSCPPANALSVVIRGQFLFSSGNFGEAGRLFLKKRQ